MPCHMALAPAFAACSTEQRHFADKEDVDRAYLDEHACEDCTLAPATEKGGMRAYL
jgi:hypothetical protein